MTERTGKIASFISLKGGVGKTTLAIAISEGLANRGCKILLIDLDAQCNLSFAMCDPTDLAKLWAHQATIYHLFDAEIRGRSRKSRAGTCYDAPSQSSKRATDKGCG